MTANLQALAEAKYKRLLLEAATNPAIQVREPWRLLLDAMVETMPPEQTERVAARLVKQSTVAHVASKPRSEANERTSGPPTDDPSTLLQRSALAGVTVEQSAHDDPWKCPWCDQVNSYWAKECGRCDAKVTTPEDLDLADHEVCSCEEAGKLRESVARLAQRNADLVRDSISDSRKIGQLEGR